MRICLLLLCAEFICCQGRAAFGQWWTSLLNGGTGTLKVLTDIDDTVVSSGGHRVLGVDIGGVDNQYKHGEFYPGVAQFCRELACAKRQLVPISKWNAEEPDTTENSVSVLTARAKELKFAMALKPTSKVAKALASHGIPRKNWKGIGEVHYGSLAEWINPSKRGWRKFKNFEKILSNDALVRDERKYVFIGDTGDKDEDAAERMATAYPTKLRAVFLHAVHRIPTASAMETGKNTSLVQTGPSAGAHMSAKPLPRDRTINGVPVYYFRTYIGAAVKAYTVNMIDRAALKRVTMQAVTDMREHEQCHRTHLLRRLTATTRGLSAPWTTVAPDRLLAAAAPVLVQAAQVPAQQKKASFGSTKVSKIPHDKVHLWRKLEENLRSKWHDLRADARMCDYDLLAYFRM